MTCQREGAQEFRVRRHERVGSNFYDEQFAVPQSAIDSNQIYCLEIRGKLNDFREQFVGHKFDGAQRNPSVTRKFEIIVVDMPACFHSGISGWFSLSPWRVGAEEAGAAKDGFGGFGGAMRLDRLGPPGLRFTDFRAPR
jgi:hypothetical protein